MCRKLGLVRGGLCETVVGLLPTCSQVFQVVSGARVLEGWYEVASDF